MKNAFAISALSSCLLVSGAAAAAEASGRDPLMIDVSAAPAYESDGFHVAPKEVMCFGTGRPDAEARAVTLVAEDTASHGPDVTVSYVLRPPLDKDDVSIVFAVFPDQASAQKLKEDQPGIYVRLTTQLINDVWDNAISLCRAPASAPAPSPFAPGTSASAPSGAPATAHM